MANIQAISVQRYSGQNWSRYTNYSFTAADAVSPISAHELSKAILSMPVGFIRANNQYVLIALQGIQAGTNLFVNHEGTWLGDYVPQVYACYPFLLLPNEEGEKVLCIDEDSNMVVDSPSDSSLPFFESDNTPTEKLREILSFLGTRETQIEQTKSLCQLLDKHELIRPWEIKIQSGEEETKLSDLYCIDEDKLSDLSPTALDELHKEKALMLVYGQLFSMRNLEVLANFGQSKISASQSAQAKASELNFDLVDDGNSINFDNL